jgi:hypothetical protein
MKYINLNQRPSPLDHSKEDVKYGIFIGQLEFVDYEQQILGIREITTNILHNRVDIQPASSSSNNHTDITIPDIGAKCICCNISSQSGFIKIAVMQWLLTSTKLGLRAIGYRGKELSQGNNIRKRFLYRKAYPGQHSVNLASGFSELEDSGWDKQGSDLSRDRLDTSARIRTQTTGTNVYLDESGLTKSGQVFRPGSDLINIVLPDGTSIQPLYLKDGSKFGSGDPLNIPIVERIERVQEFGLDYPIPQEVLDSQEYQDALGLTEIPFSKTSVSNGLDNQSYINSQAVDSLYDNGLPIVGSFTNDGVSYRRKGYIVESVKGTLVGYNPFDKSTYGQILKPTLFPLTKAGRFSTNIESGYIPVNKSTDEVESLVAASTLSVRFPYEYNTTRLDITKEGFISFEIGSTIPKENIPIDDSTYEHPHGAGRSIEGHIIGSVKLVVGKNRDEEDSIDLTTLGQVVLRLGSDDSNSLENRRDVSTQIRSKNDSILERSYQFWTPTLPIGDAGSLENKSAFEKISLRGAFDGGTILRLGARDPGVLRKHLYNGYSDAKGLTEFGIDSADRKDSRTSGRPTYGSGDSVYAFHDLTKAGQSQFNKSPYFYSGSPMSNMDRHGLSLDVHSVRDILLRIGANPDSGQSLMLDLGGGLVATIGKDSQGGRSITASLDGGTEITLKSNNEGRALQLEIDGDVNIFCKGNWHQKITGDYYLESNNTTMITFIENIIKAMNIRQSAMAQHVTEAPDIIHNQGGYSS